MNTELNHSENHNESVQQLTRREQRILFSPLRLVTLLMLCIFTTEFLVHYLLQKASLFSPEMEIMLDSVLLSVALCPVLILMLLRPLKHLITRYQYNEKQLLGHKELLELKVEARTAELNSALRKLREEVIEKQQLEQEKNETYSRLHATLESINEGFVSFDRQWRYTYVNKAAERIIGHGAAELIGRVSRELFPESAYNMFHKEICRCMEDNCPVSFETFIPEPRNRWYENRCYPSPDGVSVFFSDITERKCAEEKFRELSDYLESVREQERLAISREIHDEMGQTLTAFKLDLSWIEHRFMSGNSELIGRFNAMRSSLDLLITKAQNLSAELRPPLLDNLGLAAAIDWQAREFKRRCGIEFNLLLIEDIKVNNKKTGTAIMRILQEALTNIARHSKATEVTISLCRSDTNDLVLEIFDNGCGISPKEIDAPQAFGLMGMRERARLCQGELTIKGVPGEGTTIRLEIPHRVEEEVL